MLPVLDAPWHTCGVGKKLLWTRMRSISSFMTLISITKVKLWLARPCNHGIGPLTCLLGAKCELLAWERQWVRVNSAYAHCLHDLELIIMTRHQWSGCLTRGQNTYHLVSTQQVSWWPTIQNVSFLSLEHGAWWLWWSGAEKCVFKFKCILAYTNSNK